MPASSPGDRVVGPARPAWPRPGGRPRAGHEVVVVERAPRVGGLAGPLRGRRPAGRPRQPPAPPRDAAPTCSPPCATCSATTSRCVPATAASACSTAGSAFPLRTGDLLRRLPPGFAARAALDAVTGPLRRPAGGHVRRGGPGRARPRRARRASTARTPASSGTRRPATWPASWPAAGSSAASPLDVARRLVRGAPPEGRTFLYPRRGFGQIAEALADAAVAAGAEVRLGSDGRAARARRRRPRVGAAPRRRPPLDARRVLVDDPARRRLAGWPRRPSTGRRARRPPAAAAPGDGPPLPGRSTGPAGPSSTPTTSRARRPVDRVSEPKNYRDSATDPAGTPSCAPSALLGRRRHLAGARRRAGRRLAADLQPGRPARGRGSRTPRAAGCPRLPRVPPGFEEDLRALEDWADDAAGVR